MNGNPEGSSENLSNGKYPAEQLRQEIRDRQIILSSPPETVNIELTGRCNVKPACVFCYGKNQRGYKDPDSLSMEQLNWYLAFMTRCRRVNDCSYGEPLLYPGLEHLINRLRSSGVEFGFTTNGLLLNEKRSRFLLERADYVDFIVSLNAATLDTYYRLTGQDIDKTIRNLELFTRLNVQLRPQKDLPLCLSYIVVRSNYDEVPEFLRMAVRLGIRKVMLRHLFDLHSNGYTCASFGSVFDYDHERLPLTSYRKLEQDIGAAAEFKNLEIIYLWNEKESFFSEFSERGVDMPCLFPWKFLCVRLLHDMYAPCPFLKKSIASTTSATLDEVWNGQIMADMRRSLGQGKIPEFCLSFGDMCPLVMAQREAGARKKLSC
jgi:MoaA/NifB/PqqE/SkfB family radical SAM enzyme